MGTRVLLVDDEPAFLRALRRILARECEVVCASSSRMAFSRLAHGDRFDAILCDLRLPDLAGTDLFDVIEREWPDQAERMVFVTGAASPEEQASLRARGKEVLSKPCSAAHIRAAVARAAARPRKQSPRAAHRVNPATRPRRRIARNSE